MAKLKRVYIVTGGEYSDYRIRGVYSSRELADQVLLDDSYKQVEDWVLDENEAIIRSGQSIYEVIISKETGHVRWSENAGPFGEVSDVPRVIPYRDGTTEYEFRIVAKSTAHAVKIASERRRKLLAAEGVTRG